MIARLLFALALIASAANAQTLSGVVRTSACEPLPGADVILWGDGTGRRTVSGAGGLFAVDNLTEPRYQLRIGIVGFRSYEREVLPNREGTAPLTVILPLDEIALAETVENGPPQARAWYSRPQVRVQDYDCRPIAGATVSITGRKEWTATADGNGIVKLTGAPSGSNRIAASADGYTSASIDSVSLPFKFEKELVISLRRGTREPADRFVRWLRPSDFESFLVTDEPRLKDVRIVAMGDSTTAGTPAFKSPREFPPNGSGDVTSQYAYWLMKSHPDWEVINQGVNAQRSDVIAARFDEDVIAKKPAVVVIIAGVNDVYQGRPAQHVKDQLAAMYKRARDAGIRVVAGTIIPYNTATPDQNARMHEINDWIRAQGDAGVVTFVDTRAAVAAPGRPDTLVSSPDGLHPDAAGYRRMAEAIAPAIARALR
jgi:lysophospholipase L1-like esterase